MKNLSGKKLLVLGGSASNVQLIHFAQGMGAYVYVTDNMENRPGKAVADAAFMISNDDYDSLASLIKAEHIDGIATGAGEWNVVNAMRLAKITGLPYYASEEQWNVCQDKRNFKDCCKRYGVPVLPDFSLSLLPKDKDYPVIVKPVDGCSSRGISICHDTAELERAIDAVRSVSRSQNMIIEKYVDNGGVTIDAKYVVVDGVYYLEALGERHVLENGLITAISFYPSAYLKIFLSQVHPFVKPMFDALGYRNGVFFFQAIPDSDKIYVYEMGLRVSGGMIYNMTEAVGCNNAMKMLIHHTLTGEMCEKKDLALIDPMFHGKKASTVALPLRLGTIASINGMDRVMSKKGVIDVTVYYGIGHKCIQQHINTLDQLFARVMVVADSDEELYSILKEVRNEVSVKDAEGRDLIIWDTFDRLIDR